MAAIVAHIDENESQFSLANISTEERDHLLATIEFTDEPRMYYWDVYTQDIDEVVSAFDNVCNYSELYRRLNRFNNKMPDVSQLRTGDALFTGENIDDYGGRMYYVVWLNKDLVEIPEISEELIEQLAEAPEYDGAYDAANNRPFDTTTGGMRFVPRSADGYHNDGKHDCYLFIGASQDDDSMPSSVVSSAPNFYYQKSIFQVIDPLLTHSESFLGRIIREAKESLDWADNPAFPNEYIGFSMDYETIADGFEWVEPDPTRGDLLEPRNVLNKHFASECSFYFK